MIHNFLNGGAGVCYLARQHGFELKIVDGGVDFNFPVIPQLIDRKVQEEPVTFFTRRPWREWKSANTEPIS